MQRGKHANVRAQSARECSDKGNKQSKQKINTANHRFRKRPIRGAQLRGTPDAPVGTRKNAQVESRVLERIRVVEGGCQEAGQAAALRSQWPK
jgi:hypothetical protein